MLRIARCIGGAFLLALLERLGPLELTAEIELDLGTVKNDVRTIRRAIADRGAPSSATSARPPGVSRRARGHVRRPPADPGGRTLSALWLVHVRLVPADQRARRDPVRHVHGARRARAAGTLGPARRARHET